MSQDLGRMMSVLMLLGQAWKQYPDMPFCQLLSNIVGECENPLGMTDDEFTQKLMEFFMSDPELSKRVDFTPTQTDKEKLS